MAALLRTLAGSGRNGRQGTAPPVLFRADPRVLEPANQSVVAVFLWGRVYDPGNAGYKCADCRRDEDTDAASSRASLDVPVDV